MQLVLTSMSFADNLPSPLERIVYYSCYLLMNSTDVDVEDLVPGGSLGDFLTGVTTVLAFIVLFRRMLKPRLQHLAEWY